jgi:hypothetical protein
LGDLLFGLAGKTNRLKQAKDEAEAEVRAYKEQREAEAKQRADLVCPAPLRALPLIFHVWLTVGVFGSRTRVRPSARHRRSRWTRRAS